ncbi:MAG TPA: choice-of-anchor P family protein [Rhodanobacteraceae bacterium]|jgi:hypothetical protein|nr:choice-of-anchor P family protein [Rhodanobacteraceae bacterium]
MIRHHHSRDGLRLSALVGAILMGVASLPAQAETGSANAGDVVVHINVLGVAELNVDPQAPSGFSGATDATYQQNSLPSMDQGNAFVNLTTDTIASEAEYQPGVSLSAAGSDVTIQNLNLSAVSLLGTSLFSIGANTISSESQVIGYCLPPGRQMRRPLDDLSFFNGFDNGNLTPGGPGPTPPSVTLDGVDVSVLGIPVPNIPVNPSPNTSVDLSGLGIVGATLILNEQAISGDGVNMSSLSSNALHLTLNAAGVITADVVLGHSDSTLDCTQ